MRVLDSRLDVLVTGSRGELECPRCRQPATAAARRRGRCLACGASLVAVTGSRQAKVRDYLYGRHALPPTGREAEPSRSPGG